MKFDLKNKDRKVPRDRSLVELLQSPAKMASGFSAILLAENLDDLCD